MKSVFADQTPCCSWNVQISSLDTSLLSHDQFSSLRRLRFQISHPPWIKLEAYVSCANQFELQPHSIMKHQNSRRRGTCSSCLCGCDQPKKKGKQKKNIYPVSIKSAKLGNAEHLFPRKHNKPFTSHRDRHKQTTCSKLHRHSSKDSLLRIRSRPEAVRRESR